MNTVSEEQVLFNKLGYEEQQFILKQMRLLQPCESICEEDNKDNFTGWKMYQDGKEVCSIDYSTNEEKKIPEKLDEDNAIWEEQARDIDYYFKNTINEIIDYLESQV